MNLLPMSPQERFYWWLAQWVQPTSNYLIVDRCEDCGHVHSNFWLYEDLHS